MGSDAEDVARRVANRLSGRFGVALPANLEAVIHGSSETGRTFEAATFIALATLLLNIAKFAWDIHKDNLKPPASPPSHDTIARLIRMEVAVPSDVTPSQRDELIRVVLDELPRT